MAHGVGRRAGSVIGSVVGFSLLVIAAIFIYRRRGACGCNNKQVGDLEAGPLGETYDISTKKKQLPKRDFQKGDNVFCRCGGGCDFGTITSKGDGEKLNSFLSP